MTIHNEGEVGSYEDSEANILCRRLLVATTIAIHSSFREPAESKKSEAGRCKQWME